MYGWFNNWDNCLRLGLTYYLRNGGITSAHFTSIRERLTVRFWPFSAGRDRQQSADSVEKVGFSVRLNSGTAPPGEPTHHIEWFLGPSLTFAALLLG